MDPEPYVFDKECLVLPADLKEGLPSEITQGFIHARWAASKGLWLLTVKTFEPDEPLSSLQPAFMKYGCYQAQCSALGTQG